MGAPPLGRTYMRRVNSPSLLVAITVSALLAVAVWSAGTVTSPESSPVLVQADGDAEALSRLQNERGKLVNAIHVDQASAVPARPAGSSAPSEPGEEAAGAGSAAVLPEGGCGRLCQMRKMIIKARSAVDSQANAECSQLAGGCVTIPPTFHPAVRSPPAAATPARSAPVVHTYPAAPVMGSVQSGSVVSAPVRSAPVHVGSVQSGSVQSGSVQSGSVQYGSVQTGAIQRGKVQYAEPPAPPAAPAASPRIYRHVISSSSLLLSSLELSDTTIYEP